MEAHTEPRRVALLDGQQVLLRRLVPEDAALYPDFMAAITREDLRLRFFVTIRELTPSIIERLTRFDPKVVMAFAAIDEATGKLLGVVRLHNDASGESGEYAVLVRSRMKGHGLGWLLMQRIIDYARTIGLKSIHGQVLAENTTMLLMCGELGFEIADDPSEHGVKTALLALDRSPA